MDQSSMDFWQNHSDKFLEMVFSTDKREVLRFPDGYAKCSRECGDTMEIFLSVRGGSIVSASFQTDGCLYSHACANAAVHLVEGRSLEEACEITAEEISDFLETLPKADEHCAELAARTLHLALRNARETVRNPWKKFYALQ